MRTDNDYSNLEDLLNILKMRVFGIADKKEKEILIESSLNIDKIIEEVFRDKSYRQVIGFERVASDISIILDPSLKYDPHDYDCMKSLFLFGILNKLSGNYKDMNILFNLPDDDRFIALSALDNKIYEDKHSISSSISDSDPYLTVHIPGKEKQKSVGIALKLKELAEKYSEDIIENRKPLEFRNNSNKAVIDVFASYHFFNEAINSHNQGKGYSSKISGHNTIAQRLGNMYKNFGAVKKNIFSFAYGLAIGMLAIPTGLELQQADAVYTAALSSAVTNGFFPMVVKGVDFNDTLTHTPGLIMGFYTSMAILGSIK